MPNKDPEEQKTDKKAVRRKWYLENREKALKGSKACKLLNKEQYAFMDSIRGARSRKNFPEKHLLQKARSRAKKFSLKFDLDETDIVIPEFCPIFGLKLEHAVGSKTAKANSPSLDRIDPSLGYTKGNVRVISYRANTLKNNATLEEMYLIVKDLEKLEEMKNGN